MAKSSKSKTGTRDDAVITTSVRFRPTDLRKFEDFRTFDPAPALRPARLFSGVTATVGPANTTPKKKALARGRVPYQIAFTAPADTLVCVRRRQRREVLFAKSKTGKRGQKRPRWSKWSSTKC